MFNGRVVVGPQKSFSHTDLLEYVEMLLKESKEYEERSQERSNYSWLKSKPLTTLPSQELDELKPIVQQMSSENLAIIAVKLDTLTEDVTSSRAILAAFKSILEEQYNAQMIEERVKRKKGTKTKGKRDRNRVHPELLPPGRQATVSFILHEL